MTTPPELLVSHIDGGIVQLTLNRPDKLNALSRSLLEAMSHAFTGIAKDTNASCVILSGAGRAFCAGHDLAEMRATPEREAQIDLFSLCSAVMQQIEACPVPVIAGIHGIATAAGCQLAASCDLGIAAASARFAVSGINLGLFCSTPSVALTRSVGPKQAFDMLFTGAFISAEKALQIGLISEIAGDEALEDAVLAKARTIAGKHPAAVRLGKALFRRQRTLPLAEAYALSGEAMADNMMDPDTQALIDAFINKKPLTR